MPLNGELWRMKFKTEKTEFYLKMLDSEKSIQNGQNNIRNVLVNSSV